MFSRPTAKLETDRAQQPATGFREATLMLQGRVSLEHADRACRALMTLRSGSESHVAAHLDLGVRIYFRYPGEQIPATEIEAAASKSL